MATGGNRIRDILALAGKRLKGREKDNIAALIPNYWAMIAYEDLQRDATELLSISRKHYALAANRRQGQLKIATTHDRETDNLVVEVVSDDMPFLFDSASNALHKMGYNIGLANHPVVWVLRDGRGKIQSLQAAEPDSNPDGRWRAEALMRFELESPGDGGGIKALESTLKKVFDDVRVVVDGWLPLRGKAAEIRFGFERPHLPVDEAERAQLCAFLEWVEDNNFTFISYIYAKLKKSKKNIRDLVPDPKTGLGLKINASPWNNLTESAAADKLLNDYLDADSLLVITKANQVSPVHRAAHLDYIAIKDYDRHGSLLGEHRFYGLFTRSAYNSRALDIPLLATRIDEARQRAHFPEGSHNAKMLLQILETFPRDDLFQQSAADLYSTAMGVLAIDERNRVRVFARLDPFLRYFSLLIYLPRDRYSQSVREQIQGLLSTSCASRDMTFNIQFNESSLARLHLIIQLQPDSPRELDTGALELAIERISRDWRDDFRQSLLEHCGRKRARQLFDAYSSAFTPAYRAKTSAEDAVRDVLELEQLCQSDEPLGVRLLPDPDKPELRVQIRGYYRHHPVALAEAQPRLSNMGLRLQTEDLYSLRRSDGTEFWIQDFRAETTVGTHIEAESAAPRFEQAFLEIERGNCEDDWFNQLVLVTHLDWHQVGTLRAYSRYLKQLGFRFGRIYISETLTRNAGVTELLMKLFESRFKPGLENRDHMCKKIDAQLLAALDEVSSLDADRILRSLRSVILGTLRTNFYCEAESSRSVWTFKLATRDIPEAPRPRPMFEIWVHSPRFEAVHLRNGLVARGGLRWSDRPEDFRTEVLGLVKAQIVKNAVIVPVGAKGGFVCRKNMTDWDRQAIQAEVVACYRSFMAAMLEITDNLVAEKIVPPTGVVRQDGDDPYLVVAADKGTATFSDIANEIALEHGFWIGDAFASGGSNGYDHKKMGITAAGAWESVKRHFREMGRNIQREEFTVVGVGDMAGDVFGNGMLLSKKIQLVAAFNHLHIFIDPSPDAASSYAERRRLFRKKGSSWDDYDRSLISRGGGIYLRSEKSITPSAAACAALGISEGKYTPDELVSAILKAPVDLLWNGGIGTYVKGSGESHEQVGDRANDAVRVNGEELRCKVVGEGGNLGLTQLGRVEFSRAGGRCITDFIDNSGGVDSSDMEVNIKILLNAAVADDQLKMKERNMLLKNMTADVKEAVLRDNYMQALAIGMISASAPERLGEHAELIRILERDAGLDRRLEYLPDEKTLQQRRNAGEGLTRPEIAVLLSYSKIDLYNALLSSDVPEDPYLGLELVHYFPTVLHQHLSEYLPRHRLRREIICTRITNSLNNRMGAAFAHRLSDEMGVALGDIARAYTVARDAFGIRDIWESIEALDNKVPDTLQLEMKLETRRLIKHVTLWLVQSGESLTDIESLVLQLGQCARSLRKQLNKLMSPDDLQRARDKRDALQAQGVPEATASTISLFKALYLVPDMWWLQNHLGASEKQVFSVYFATANMLELSWTRRSIERLKADSRWEALARTALMDDLYLGQRRLVAKIIDTVPAKQHTPAGLATHFSELDQFSYLQSLLRELQSASAPDYLALSVLLRQLARLGS